MNSKLLFTLFAVMLFCACSNNNKSCLKESGADNDIVYICTGPRASVYHKLSVCRGLNRCSGTIEEVTVEEAINANRRPCRICCPY